MKTGSLRILAIALTLAAVMAAPALHSAVADDDRGRHEGEWRGHDDGERGWHERDRYERDRHDRDWREQRERAGHRYVPPPVVAEPDREADYYVPPPTVIEPPSGLNIVIPLNFR